MFLMVLLIVLAMDCKAGGFFGILAYFLCILRRKVSRSGNIMFRSQKAMLEVLVRGGRRYINRRARRSVIL